MKRIKSVIKNFKIAIVRFFTRTSLVVGISTSLGIFVGLGVGYFWIPTTKETVQNYIYDDLEKISIARKKTNGEVYYDYFAKSFYIKSSELKPYIDNIAHKFPNSYLFIKYGMDYKNTKYNNFTFAFSATSDPEKYLKLDGINDLPIDSGWSDVKMRNYSNAFNRVKKENGWIKKIKGHNHNFDDGVVYPILEAAKFLNDYPSEIYYFYFGLAPIVENGDTTLNSFTTMIISGNSQLRQNGANVTERNSGAFYGDAGTGCCP